jgi:hypothetical protein
MKDRRRSMPAFAYVNTRYGISGDSCSPLRLFSGTISRGKILQDARCNKHVAAHKQRQPRIT